MIHGRSANHGDDGATIPTPTGTIRYLPSHLRLNCAIPIVPESVRGCVVAVTAATVAVAGLLAIVVR